MANGWSPLANFVSAPGSFRQGVSRACALWVSYWSHAGNAFWGINRPDRTIPNNGTCEHATSGSHVIRKWCSLTVPTSGRKDRALSTWILWLVPGIWKRPGTLLGRTCDSPACFLGGAVVMPPVNQNLLMDTHVEFEISFVIAKRRATSMIDRKVNASVDHL